ncbi:hypothetical protein [uncultured Rhodoblastus sp.]|uniref:hypothetical protein n=1 Tax=uncultured Rhodoblastus sp. TaxID=543037 RepID=UPI0025D48E86|nr:hypothetical protein [uncultured Rhodoblastus sp.]
MMVLTMHMGAERIRALIRLHVSRWRRLDGRDEVAGLRRRAFAQAMRNSGQGNEKRNEQDARASMP